MVYNARVVSHRAKVTMAMASEPELAMSLARITEPADPSSDPPTAAQLRALWLPFVLFVVVSVADTISSVIMLRNGMMEEANPMMRWVWEAGGALAFCCVKALLVAVPLALFNALKVRRYWFIRRVVWVTILGYVVIYGFFFYIGNF